MNGPDDRPEGFAPGNQFDKYRTGNPVYRSLMRGFLDAAAELVTTCSPERVLEIGCGPGDLAGELFRGHADYVGIDVSAADVARARAGLPEREFLVASAYRLPFGDRSFDLVVACEVLEHLESPREALAEIHRVCAGHALISVPWEPVWRMLNVARGAYLGHWGNTPGHIQHFTRRSFRELVREGFDTVHERRPFPWTMSLGRRRVA